MVNLVNTCHAKRDHFRIIWGVRRTREALMFSKFPNASWGSVVQHPYWCFVISVNTSIAARLCDCYM